MHTSALHPDRLPAPPPRVRWGGAVLLGAACVLTSLSAVVTKSFSTRYNAPALVGLSARVDAPGQAAGGHAALDPSAMSGEPGAAPPGAIIDPLLSSRADALAPAPAFILPDSITLDPRVRYFDGRPVRPVGTMTMRVTAYSPDERSCGTSADGITASLHAVETNAFRLVAADSKVLPLGSIISVPGYDQGRLVPVLDRGGAIKGHRLDVLFPTHEQARKWGVRNVEVTVYEYADGGGNAWRKVRDSR